MKRVEQVIEKVLREDGKFSHLNIEDIKYSESKLFRPIPKYAETENITIMGNGHITPEANTRKIIITLPTRDPRYEYEFQIILALIKNTNNIFLTTRMTSATNNQELKQILEPDTSGFAVLHQSCESSYIIKEHIVKEDFDDKLEFYYCSIRNMIETSSFAGETKQEVKDLIIKIIKYNIYDCYNIKPKPETKRAGKKIK